MFRDGRLDALAMAALEMPLFGPFYPVLLQAVMNHAERLAEVLAQRERVTRDFDAGGLWLIGRANELQCVAALTVVDWHEGRLSAEAAAGKLARYIRELHDGMAMHLDVEMPACCHPPGATMPGIRRTPWRSTPAAGPAKCVTGSGAGDARAHRPRLLRATCADGRRSH